MEYVESNQIFNKIKKLGSRISILLLFTALLYSCSSQSYILTDSILENGDFSNDSLAGWGVEVASDSSIKIVNEASENKRIAKFTLRGGERIKNGHRVELVKVDCALPGTEWQYEFSFKLDKSYTFSPLVQIIQQFHDYPNFSEGETWKTYKGNPPVVSFTIRDQECILYINNKVKKSDKVGRFKIKRDEWYNIKLLAKWSQGTDGYVEAFVNDKPITKDNGTDNKYYTPTLLNNEGNYFKLGMYFDDKIKNTQTIYYADVKIRQILR